MNSYVISGKGFFVEWNFDLEDYTKSPIWSHSLRDAKHFNSSSARKFIEKNDFEAFLWQPKKEEPIRGMFRVVKQTSYNMMHEEERLVQIWEVQKVMMESKSDVKFLMGMEKNNGDYLEYKDAVELCNQRNMELFSTLKEKLNIVES